MTVAFAEQSILITSMANDAMVDLASECVAKKKGCSMKTWRGRYREDAAEVAETKRVCMMPAATHPRHQRPLTALH